MLYNNAVLNVYKKIQRAQHALNVPMNKQLNAVWSIRDREDAGAFLFLF